MRRSLIVINVVVCLLSIATAASAQKIKQSRQKQSDGSWKVALDIFNSDLPADSSN
ncbi:MAG TPA: hypothetical protein VLL54_17145 [Pyrinomonadaceae bacterium]|nr:hypothetical protein [Pyrinomonadaceae bacterium]